MPTFENLHLCDTVFWNLNHTWHTESPKFSTCLVNTALVWPPACVLLGAIIREYFHLRSRKKLKTISAINWNIFNVSRLLLVVALFLLGLTKAHWVFRDAAVAAMVLSTLLAPIIQSTSCLALLLIYCLQRRTGRHTSAWTWFYLLISVVAGAASLHSAIAASSLACYLIRLDLVRFVVLLVLFALECSGDTAPGRHNNSFAQNPGEGGEELPELRASFCSRILFSWYTGFLWFGFRNHLTTRHLWASAAKSRVEHLAGAFQRIWVQSRRLNSSGEPYETASGELKPRNSIFWVLYKLLRCRLLAVAGLKLVSDILQYLTPLVLKNLLAFISTDGNGQPEWHGTFYAILLLLLPTIQTIFLGNHLVRVEKMALEVRSTIVGAVYRKSMQLSSSSRLQSTSGEIINLMSVDSNRFYELLLNLNLLWSAPFQVWAALLLLYGELGWCVLAGVALMLLVIAANLYITQSSKRAHTGMMHTKDDRIKQMNELLGGIKVVKLYAWENSFIGSLLEFRQRELKFLDRILFLDAVQSFIWQCMPFLVSLVTFAIYVLVDEANVLTAEKAFVSLALFNLLKYPLIFLPAFFTNLITAMVSARRLDRFLNSDELVRYVTRNESGPDAIAIQSGCLSWSKEERDSSSKAEPPEASKAAVLKDINLRVKRGSFVAIIGQVASGKSSLLSAILGEMHRIAGRLNVCKGMSVAYVPQQAWIQNMTVKDNILFGSALDEKKYRKILSVCALESDLAIIPGGDQAEIGERGINLSGGQKQRVSLARACYSDSDLCLLDDPLSALDSHVAKHVFDGVLSSTTGILKDRTRVLATNSLFVLPHADHIIILDKGRIVESGSYQELTANHEGYLKDIMFRYSGNSDQSPVRDHPSVSETTPKVPVPSLTVAQVVVPQEVRDTTRDEDLGKLVEVETVETGSVDYRVYWAYAKAFSKLLMLITVLTSAASSGFNVITNIWLAIWTSDADTTPGDRSGYPFDLPVGSADSSGPHASLKLMRLLVFAALGSLQCSMVLVCTLVLSHGAVRASKELHHELLARILHSPMSFFDTTPIGRIVNRFAKDIDVIDLTLPCTLRSWLNCIMPILSTVILICDSFPSFLVLLTPLAIGYYFIQRVFIVTTRQLKRLESTTRSPIYSNFNETLSGMSTIRAYDSASRFIRLSDSLVDRNQSCSYPNVVAFRWLAIRLDFTANILSMCVALLSVHYRHQVGAGAAGLMISYTLSITGALAWLLRMSSDLETNIVSVERVLEYLNNKQEDSWLKDGRRPAADWPQQGAIQIGAYSTRYRDQTELVLRDISIDIRPREKIGIVGRTGSGKSSLSLSLFRILEPSSGRIRIDQCDIAQYGLHDIRSRLTIIPQDPVLFSGTLRFNLDPLQQHSELDIWRALELAHLKGYISSHKFGLDYQVTEYGENFSVGQRQLICLARAILRKSKILILDEATASVDLETDSIVQRTIRQLFKDCTIITIAHRLHTILDSDRILVLDKGSVKELDSPERLVMNPDSAFSSLIEDAGIEVSNVLKLAATRCKQH